jgi:hypothetical protein
MGSASSAVHITTVNVSPRDPLLEFDNKNHQKIEKNPRTRRQRVMAQLQGAEIFSGSLLTRSNTFSRTESSSVYENKINVSVGIIKMNDGELSSELQEMIAKKSKEWNITFINCSGYYIFINYKENGTLTSQNETLLNFMRMIVNDLATTNLRIGLHIGPLQKATDSINFLEATIYYATQLALNSPEAMAIHISSEYVQYIDKEYFGITYFGKINIKEIGLIDTYFLIRSS